MSRPIFLCSGSWADLPIEELVSQVAEWGYQGLDLCCWGDHFEVQRALSEEDYATQRLELLGRLELSVPVLSNHRVSQALCDPIGWYHQTLLPDYVWGDGHPGGVRERALAEMVATARAAQKLGVSVLAGFTGSPLWFSTAGQFPFEADRVEEILEECARQLHLLLDACQEAGLRYACQVGPGQLAFDGFTAERVLDLLEGREEFGFTFDPVGLHWQGVDPIEFVRWFPDRIYHVHVSDAVITLNGRSSLLGSYLPLGHPHRGWHPRSPGRGGIDWEGIIRALNDIGYDGPLAVDWNDPGMDRTAGAAEACAFVRRLDFDPPPRSTEHAFD